MTHGDNPAPGEAESLDPEVVDGAAAAGGPDLGAPVAGPPYETPEETAARVKELTSDLQRLQAEYVNYKRRVDRDRDLVVQNARLSVLDKLLPVLDDVDRAREHEELSGGFKAVAESLERVVAAAGLVKYGAKGDPFDPRLHEALMHGTSSEVTETVCDHVVQAGYQYGDRVVRAAKVTVLDPQDPAQATSPEPAPAPVGQTGDQTGDQAADQTGDQPGDQATGQPAGGEG